MYKTYKIIITGQVQGVGFRPHVFLLAQQHKLTGKSYRSVISAYRQAQGNAKRNDLIFIGGSTFVVAEVL